MMAGLVLLLMLALLPSALNLPQSNPSQTLEYAPVPPEEDDSDAPPDGNVSSFSFASGSRSASVGSAGVGEDSAGAGRLVGAGKNPSTKRCVGNPPRQTEDRLSPPCVAFFSGDNGGATHRGVTADEVRVVLYEPYWNNCGQRNFVDMAKPEEDPDGYYQYLRAYQRFFNERYQTYGRFVHFWVHQGTCEPTPENQRADALEAYKRIRPFGVMLSPASQLNVGSFGAYLDVLVERGAVGFLSPSSSTSNPRRYYQRFPGHIWGHNPTLELQAQLFAEYVCKKVVNRPVTFSGNPTDQGRPRKIGHLYANPPHFPELQESADAVARHIRQCGGEISLTRTTTYTNTATATLQGDPGPTEEAAANMAAFKQEGITTILWTGLVDISHGRAGAAIDYRPEVVMLGSLNMDTNEAGSLQDPSFWRNVWTVSQNAYIARPDGQPCAAAALEADPEADVDEARYQCDYLYIPMRQLFTGVQLAGPRLTPESMDEGFHAIPAVASTDASVPACFYEPGDYTCVKDAIAEWWDPAGPGDNYPGQPGCWRLSDNSKRYLAGTIPREDVVARKRANDPCNNN